MRDKYPPLIKWARGLPFLCLIKWSQTFYKRYSGRLIITRRHKMKNISLFFLLLFLCSGLLLAQPDSTKSKVRFGIGATLGNRFLGITSQEISNLPADYTNIYFPIINPETFRLEPEVGIWRTKSKRDNSESTNMNLRFGVGFFSFRLKQKTAIYYGIRVGVVWTSRTSSSDSESNEDSKSDYYFGVATGGEYFFSKKFSIGAETQLNYITQGNYDKESEDSNTIISTRALLVFRFYLL
jgi:opacity protein-like surface antigen